MKVPILKRGEILLTSLQGDLTDRDIVDLQEELLDMIGQIGSTGLVIDVSAMERIDSYLSRVLSETAAMVGILGCDVVISGIQPSVALTLLEIGGPVKNVKTALNLEHGIDMLSAEAPRQVKAVSGHKQVDIVAEKDVGLATAQCRKLMDEMGFIEREQVLFTTAVSELVRNVIKYAGSGICQFHTYKDQNACLIKTIVEDSGPGIDDIEKAMEVGYSTSGTLGVGLSGVKNLVDEFRISSSPKGVRVEIALHGCSET